VSLFLISSRPFSEVRHPPSGAVAQLLARHMSVGSSQNAGHGSAPAEQMPVWQVSAPLQYSRSGHGVPFGWKTSVGQASLIPSQSSAMSHWLAAGRHSAVLLTSSAGQSSLTPSQLSGRSHTPAAGRHIPVLFPSMAGQSKLAPSQVSATSQSPTAGRQIVPESAGASAGQLPAPSQFSAASHAWPALAARHSTEVGSWLPSHAPARQVSGSVQSVSLGSPHGVPSGSTTSAGQSELTPSQTSSVSQSPASGLQTVLSGFTPSAGQVVAIPSHSSGSSHSWPALAARHSTPRLPARCVQVAAPSHSSTVQVSPSDVQVVPNGSLLL
jgi:hypothetical protein